MMAKRTIRQLREERGWTQQQLAFEMGVSISAVSGLESRRNQPSLDMIQKVLQVFDVAFEEVEWPEREKKLVPAA